MLIGEGSNYMAKKEEVDIILNYDTIKRIYDEMVDAEVDGVSDVLCQITFNTKEQKPTFACVYGRIENEYSTGNLL